MCKSQIICLFTVLLGITVDQVLARPAVDPSSDLKLGRGKAPQLTTSSVVSAKKLSTPLAKTTQFKSSNYRQTAIDKKQEYDQPTKMIVPNPSMDKKTKWLPLQKMENASLNSASAPYPQ